MAAALPFVTMNKAQLVDALTARLGDRRAAAAAVDAMVEVIVDTVGSGDSVTLTGFGVFEARRRAPRTARNPRTGDTVPVGETVVPSFRPGAAFKDRVAGSEAAAAGATSAPRRAPRAGVTAASSEPARGGRRSRAAAAASAPAGDPAATADSTATDPAGSATRGAAAKRSAAKPGAKGGRTTATKKKIPPDTSAPGATEAPAKKPAARKRTAKK